MKVERHPMPLERKQLVASRCKTITRAVNRSLWNNLSEKDHSFYVGSYGRGTAIETSDIDLLIEVPEDYYVTNVLSTYNPQSRLLQVVKQAILETYPRSDIRGDGQVVVINFTDGMKFEVLPAISCSFEEQSYIYPDSHMGGNWLSTNPKKEQEAILEKDQQSNGLLKATCRHLRYIKDNYFSSYHLSGIVIDSFVYAAIGDWHFRFKKEPPGDSYETYEESLLSWYNDASRTGRVVFQLFAPGSNLEIDVNNSFECLGKVLNKMV